MKKLLSLLLALILILSLSACNNTDKPVIKDELPSEQTADATSGDVSKDTEENIYINKTYYVGEDIPEGSYIINCTKSDYGMDVVVFSTEADYHAFQNAEQYTSGEYRAAIGKHAWASFYLYEDDAAFVGLKNGNIILLDEGMCEFNKHDISSSNKLYSGIYVAGEDIPATGLDIASPDGSLKIVVFESEEKYLDYRKADRFTYGEESHAIETHSFSNDYLYTGGSSSVSLNAGMIVMIDDGTGEYSTDNGPVINSEPVEASVATGEMRAEFKAAMDSYEDFYDEYCTFMKKYKENPADLTLLTEYADMTAKLANMDEQFKTWESADLNNEELNYYLDVTNRITQKLIDLV